MFLQRASAGSGKTYKLTKIYIRNLISEKHTESDGESHYVLRHPAEMTEAHSHILAITFTNKATMEMKDRIVDSLADLAQGVRKDADGKVHTPDYLTDFQKEILMPDMTPATERDIQNTCRAALWALLNSYSDFNISTIDAFFQTVLRTFAFELDISDNYRVELDDDYLAQVGVDETLSSVNHRTRGEESNIYDWLQRIIRSRINTGLSWDIFSKGSGTSMYAELLKFAKKMNSESFKLKKEAITGYFTANPDAFVTFFEKTLSAGATKLKGLRRDCREAIEAFERTVEEAYPGKGIDEVCTKGIPTALKALKKSGIYLDGDKASGKNFRKYFPPATPGSEPGLVPLAKKWADTPYATRLAELMFEIGAKTSEWALQSAYWQTLTSKLHYLGLLGAVAQNIEKFRNENDIIPLSETNSIISRIIGTDEAPFIYERMGTALHHYLIDEFQDTSVMQWANLKPLLENSESTGHDNLIIGDAKQSIYRFRNAEPELITSRVETDFPDTEVWQSAADNKNWRSARHVVEFNNMLFEALAGAVDRSTVADEQTYHSEPEELRRALEYRKSLGALYANTRQEIENTQMPGYVEINLGKSDGIDSLGETIQDMLRRGYRQSDIAVLADTNTDCDKIIRVLMEYNRTLPPECRPIEIISEESLKIVESEAVRLIVSILTLLSSSQMTPRESRGDNKSKISLDYLVCKANYVAAMHPEADIDAVLTTADGDYDPTEEIMHTFESSPGLTLPAIVETVVHRFVPKKMRHRNAAYISAFLDLVLDFCEGNSTDLQSFLRWWNAAGQYATISSPDGIDAIQVMTIHKSKGLEFDCIIIPKAEWSLAPSKEHLEILWLKADAARLSEETGVAPELIPPYLPITPSRKLADPWYGMRTDYMDFFDKSRVDQVNKAYVGFTRAVRELRVFAPISDPKKYPDKTGSYLTGILTKDTGLKGASYNPGTQTFTFGEPTTKIHKEKKKKDSRVIDIDSYHVNADFPELHYSLQDDDSSASSDREEARNTGVIIHEILSAIRTEGDIDRALKRRTIRGIITRERAESLGRQLHEILADDRVKAWYDPKAKVLTKRDFCIEGENRRPDRVVFTPDNEAIIIDYKTGSHDHADEYKEQLKTYKRLVKDFCRQEGMTVNQISAYLLFIPADEETHSTFSIISLDELTQ